MQVQMMPGKHVVWCGIRRCQVKMLSDAVSEDANKDAVDAVSEDAS